MRSIFTNTVPTSPYRGAGRPHAAFVMERVIEHVAHELGLDSLDVRRRNFIPPDAFPYRVGVTFQDGGPTVYDSGDYERGLDTLLARLDLDRDTRARDLGGRAEGGLVGLGIGGYVEGTGIGSVRGGLGRHRPGRDGDGGHRARVAGPGPPDRVRPDRRRRARGRRSSRVRVTTGRHASARVRGGDVRLADRGRRRERACTRRPREVRSPGGRGRRPVLEAAPDDLVFEGAASTSPARRTAR